MKAYCFSNDFEYEINSIQKYNYDHLLPYRSKQTSLNNKFHFPGFTYDTSKYVHIGTNYADSDLNFQNLFFASETKLKERKYGFFISDFIPNYSSKSDKNFWNEEYYIINKSINGNLGFFFDNYKPNFIKGFSFFYQLDYNKKSESYKTLSHRKNEVSLIFLSQITHNTFAKISSSLLAEKKTENLVGGFSSLSNDSNYTKYWISLSFLTNNRFLIGSRIGKSSLSNYGELNSDQDSYYNALFWSYNIMKSKNWGYKFVNIEYGISGFQNNFLVQDTKNLYERTLEVNFPVLVTLKSKSNNSLSFKINYQFKYFFIDKNSKDLRTIKDTDLNVNKPELGFIYNVNKKLSVNFIPTISEEFYFQSFECTYFF